ncbi:CHS2, partial [[Candida] subhashii]
MSSNRGRQQDFLSPNLDTSYRGQSEDNTSTFVFQEDEPDTIPLRPDYFSTISSNIGKDESTESLDFQRPPPSHLHARSDIQGYPDRPIFDTSPIPSDNQGNPFSGDYEMQPQRRFTLSRYRPFASSSSEVFGDQEYGGRPDYGMFKGDEYELTIVPRSASAMGYGESDETVRDESDNEDYDYDGAPEKPPKPSFPKAAPFKAHNGHLVLDCPIAKELLSKLPDYKPDVEGGGF